MPAPLLQLPANGVHIWLLEVPALPHLPKAPSHLPLSDGERQRLARFAVAGAAWEFLAGRLLVRDVLSRYADVEPSTWRFVDHAHGRPEIAAPTLARPLRFNLSHTRGLAALAVCWQHDIGVDVENPSRHSRTSDIAERYFATSEVEALRALPEAAQRARFFTYWTLKEAYIKARGLGLALPLGAFAFSLGGDAAPITITFDHRIDDAPARWHFDHRVLDSGHHLALAVERASSPSAGDRQPPAITLLTLPPDYVEVALDSQSQAR